jgi:hypothetical protein
LRLVLELLEHARVVARQGGDAVARLLGDVGEAVVLPHEQRDEGAAETVDPEVPLHPRRLRCGLVDAPPPVLSVVELPGVAVVRGTDLGLVRRAAAGQPPLGEILGQRSEHVDHA